MDLLGSTCNGYITMDKLMDKLPVGKLNVNLCLYFRMYLDKKQFIFAKKSLPLKLWSTRTNNVHPFYDQKRSVYLKLQFINWLLFLHNSQLNFFDDCVLSGFTYGDKVKWFTIWKSHGCKLPFKVHQYQKRYSVTQFVFWAI